MTFRGVTRHFEDEMSFSVLDENSISLEGSHVFDIRDFEMEPPKIMMLKVYPDVSVSVKIVAWQALMHELGLCEDILDAVRVVPGIVRGSCAGTRAGASASSSPAATSWSLELIEYRPREGDSHVPWDPR